MNIPVALPLIFAKLTDYGADFAGAVLLVLALVLFVAELFAPTHGSVAVGGLVILIVGLIVLAQGTGSAVPVVLIVALALALVAFGALAVFEIVMARHRPVTTGASGLENEIGVVREELAPVGTVFVHGERWRAITEDGGTLPVETPVRVLEVHDLTLIVELAPETATTLPPLPGAYDAPPPAQRSTS
ncbi:MAG: NfeD family protein [Thermomicrobiales bacterium]